MSSVDKFTKQMYEIDDFCESNDLYSDLEITEAEYQGRKVKLNKIMQGDAKKFKVYVNTGKKNKE